jgi:LPXTG-site transpeptidase (sortase) family protein
MRFPGVLLFGVIAVIALSVTVRRADRTTALPLPTATVLVQGAPTLVEPRSLALSRLGDFEGEIAVPAVSAPDSAIAALTPTPTPVAPTTPVMMATATSRLIGTPTRAPPRATAARLIVRPTTLARAATIPTATAIKTPPVESAPFANGATSTWLPITEVAIPRIALWANVVPVRVVQEGGETTWEVPAFRVGHAQYTAGAGQIGNAVLIGHVTSLHAGAVFQSLDRARVGDIVQLASGPRRFEYRVTDVRIVPRSDISVVGWTPTASATLITCAGPWVPALDDYADRLIVRAELVPRSS